jgi:hypothetical protein
MSDITFWILVAATLLTGLLAGASLDQSIKQLPARHRIGVEAFSNYSRAADLSNGIAFYAILGLGSALLTISAAILVFAHGPPSDIYVPIAVSASLAVLHSLATIKAAPINFSQWEAQGDPNALTRIFDRFAKWQAMRAVLQVANFVSLIWAIVSYL